MTRYWIFGAGAVGSALAGYLSRQGHEVGLTARSRHAGTIQRSGLSVTSYDETFTVSLPALDQAPKTLAPETVILLTVQSHDVAASLEALSHLLPGHALVTFQNGIQAETTAFPHCPRLYGGIVRFTATMLDPGAVGVRRPGQIILGKVPQGTDALSSQLVADLNRAGFEAAESPEIQVEKMLKLVVNLVSGPAVLMKRTDREPALAAVQVALLEEAKAVLQSAGQRAEPLSGLGLPIDEMITRFRRGGSAPDGRPIYNSTWQNLHHRRKQLENRYYHGEIIRLGREHGISTPVNERTLELLEGALAQNLGPEPYSPQEFQTRFSPVVDFNSVQLASEGDLGKLEI